MITQCSSMPRTPVPTLLCEFQLRKMLRCNNEHTLRNHTWWPTSLHYRISVHIKHNWYCLSSGTHQVLNAMLKITILMVEIKVPLGSFLFLASVYWHTLCWYYDDFPRLFVIQYNLLTSMLDAMKCDTYHDLRNFKMQKKSVLEWRKYGRKGCERRCLSAIWWQYASILLKGVRRRIWQHQSE
jgi:fumarate reductase subunit D